jgi:hypothetical protein
MGTKWEHPSRPALADPARSRLTSTDGWQWLPASIDGGGAGILIIHRSWVPAPPAPTPLNCAAAATGHPPQLRPRHGRHAAIEAALAADGWPPPSAGLQDRRAVVSLRSLVPRPRLPLHRGRADCEARPGPRKLTVSCVFAFPQNLHKSGFSAAVPTRNPQTKR